MIWRVSIDHHEAQQVVLANQCLAVLDLGGSDCVMDLTAETPMISQRFGYLVVSGNPPRLSPIG
jgi:hypothetical protein